MYKRQVFIGTFLFVAIVFVIPVSYALGIASMVVFMAGGHDVVTVAQYALSLIHICGFKGFHSLKLALAREVLEEERGDVNVSNEINRDKLSQSLQNILANKVAELTETVNMMDVTQLEQILDKLEHARMVQLLSLIHI